MARTADERVTAERTPDAPQLRALLARTESRLTMLSALRGATVGMVAGIVWSVVGFFSSSRNSGNLDLSVFAVCTAFGALVAWWRARASFQDRARNRAAVELEQRVPQSRNLLTTASELLQRTDKSADAHRTVEVRELVLARADQLARTVNVAERFPSARRWQAAGTALVMWIVLAFGTHSVMIDGPEMFGERAVAAARGRIEIDRVDVRVAPPAYTKRGASVERDPVRVDALAGSALSIAIQANADTVLAVLRDSTGEHRQSLTRSANGAFEFAAKSTGDGYLALEPRAIAGAAGTRRLIVLSTHRDESPRVRIVEPAKDLVVPDAKRTVAVRVEADDDLAIGTLRLKYTKVSGSGERFTFSEGEVPVAITRQSAVLWRANASLALEPLLQEAGDLVVYRAVVTDLRPGAEPVESDSYIAELAAPGGLAALGFSVDPDEDRYALSQQMIVLKTERLIARKSSMPAAVLADSAAQLAAEQRRVRAEFVFMMGGELAQETTGEAGEELDETAETEGEADLAAGRMVNRGRTALLSAVRSMSQAAGALTTADLVTALAREKKAVVQLQEAFARARFLMRALSQREKLDLTRRQTGKLDSLAHGASPIPEGERDAKRTAWRGVLADVLALSAHPPTDAGVLTSLAERVLQIDATSPTAQRIASQLSAAGRASWASATARVQLDSATTALSGVVRDGMRPAASAAPTSTARHLQSLLRGTP